MGLVAEEIFGVHTNGSETSPRGVYLLRKSTAIRTARHLTWGVWNAPKGDLRRCSYSVRAVAWVYVGPKGGGVRLGSLV